MKKRISVIVLSGLFLLLFSGELFSQLQEFPYPNSREMLVDSIRIHYRVWEPEGTPRGNVLFVHGFGGSTWNFRNNIDPVVKAGYEVIAIDLPGFGYSERNEKVNQSQSNRSRILWMLLGMLHPSDSSRWNLVGHSMGGGAVEAMAIMHPERTQSLTIISGMLLSKTSAFYQSFFSLSSSKKRNDFLANYARKNFITYKNLEKRLKGVYGYPPDSTLVLQYLRPLEIPGTERTVINLIVNSGEIAPLNKEALNAVPMLVVWGKKDKTISISNGKRFAREFPAAEFRVIPEAYHTPNETSPDLFNGWLIDFLNRSNPVALTNNGTL